jgi:ring-1,2-phenylacetyl-CoA epoxidase subunit PaaD
VVREAATFRTASFSPFTGRSARQGDEGQRELGNIGLSPSSGPSDHLLPVNGEKDALQSRAHHAAASVPDPEIPVVTVADLGILRSVEIEDGIAVARVTPTYSGCPATLAIELAIETALRDAGFEARIERVMSPAWTTDWITDEGREKLRAYGIAPPQQASNSIRALFGETEVACPKCGSPETERLSEFGSTPCKALYRCTACREPFDYFKCI